MSPKKGSEYKCTPHISDFEFVKNILRPCVPSAFYQGADPAALAALAASVYCNSIKWMWEGLQSRSEQGSPTNYSAQAPTLGQIV